MKITTITYGESYQTTEDCWKKVGIEATLEDGDSVQDCYDTLKEEVRQAIGNTANIEQSKPVDRVESLIQSIQSCTHLSVLQTYRLMAKQDFKLQEAYDKKLEELKK